MLKLVLKVRLQALLAVLFRTGKGSQKSRVPKGVKIALFALLFVYLIAVLGGSLGTMLYSIGKGFISFGLDWVYFVLVGVMAFIIGFIGSVFMTKAELFEARDNELLLSMPIRPVYILGGRLLMLWIVELVYSLLVFVPAGIVYFMLKPITLPTLLCYIAVSIAMSFLTLSLSCFFGWLFAMLTRNMRRKNLFTTVFLFAFFAAYMYLCSNMYSLIGKIIEQGEALANAIKKVLPPIYFFAEGACGDILSMLIFLACALIPFAVVVWLLSASFLKITTKKTGLKSKKYTGGGISVTGSFSALVKKELGRFFSLPLYIFNSGMGMVMLILFTGFMFIEGGKMTEQLSVIPELMKFIPVGIALIMAFCASMSATTAPSLSLEGKSFELLKSLPVDAKKIYLAKITSNLILTLPILLISGIALQFTFEAEPFSRILILLLPVCVQIFTAFFGMLCNIWFPRFEWINEATAIKQSMSAMISVFGGMGIIAAPCLIYGFWLRDAVSVDVYCVICSAVFLLLSLVVWYVISTYGEKKYITMS